MPFRSLESDNFKKIMQDHILNTIEYLFNEHQEFGVACEIEYVKFNPELPHDIQNALPEITLFMLANYSFESASIDMTNFSLLKQDLVIKILVLWYIYPCFPSNNCL